MTRGSLYADHALLPDGWARDVLVEWNEDGTLTRVAPGAPAAAGIERTRGPLLPGLPNLHSHAFQRAFAGLTEYRSAAQDSFWSWRHLMYRFAARLTPESLEDVATGLYAEMLAAGYTSVCEFHYLHNGPDGRPYADDAAMARALIRAAARTGMVLTLLPVLYQCSGFGGLPAREDQRRFIRSTDSILRLVAELAAEFPAVRLGLAPHSLRAVPPEALRDAVAGLRSIDARAPIHIHVAEQIQEVEDCVAWSGRRPVAWLLDNAPVDARWCLVHATHMNPDETRQAAASGAVAGLCPTTEANLGDGLFDFAGWRAHGGAWGLGSDSHACVDAAEELMILEYGQRLSRRQRNIGADARQPSVATALMLGAVQGGAQASGRPVAGLAPGQQANLVTLDARAAALCGLSTPADQFSAHVFGSSRTSAVDTVWTAGVRRVAGGKHDMRDEASAALVRARRRLLQD
jgi:formimidoylglutamate deiminase